MGTFDAAEYQGPERPVLPRIAAVRSPPTSYPVGDVVIRRPYVQQQSLIDVTQPNGRRYYWKSEYLPGVEKGFLGEFIKHAEGTKSPHSAMLIFPLHGALGSLPEDHSAVGNRGTGMVFNIAASWEDSAHDDENIKWARDAWSDLKAYSTGGTYINFLTEEEGDDRIQDAYGGNYDRLIDIKTKYDLDNFFRTNKNIAPRD